jgi:hypothetical protein
MQITIVKLVGLLIAAAYVGVMFIESHKVTFCMVKTSLVLLIPLSFICFPEEIGSFTGYFGRGGNVDTETPSIMVTIIGWFLLIGLPAFLVVPVLGRNRWI